MSRVPFARDLHAVDLELFAAQSTATCIIGSQFPLLRKRLRMENCYNEPCQTSTEYEPISISFQTEF